MDRDKLLAVTALLNLPKGEWVVFGGACLTAYGIRTTSDLELFVTSDLYKRLHDEGWEEKVARSTGAKYITKHCDDIPVLAFITCGSDNWRPNVEAYLRQPELVNGLPCMPLAEMYRWKAATARPKDLADLELIQKHHLTSFK